MDASSNGSNDDDSVFSRLPPDLAAMIFGYLDLRERMNARLVSQRWNELVLSDVQQKLRIHASSSSFGRMVGRNVIEKTTTTTTADFVQRSSSRKMDARVVLPGESLNEQIKQLPPALMNRVFDIELRLAECSPATGILDDIASSVIRPIKLHLDFTATPRMPAMLSNNATADASIVKQFPTLQLSSLSAAFEFPANGDYSALNYFRMDKLSNDEQNVTLKLKHCGQSSNELPFVIERFPQLTALKMEFGENQMWHRNEEHLYREAPDWQKMSQLTNLQTMMIRNNDVAVLSAPELSKGFGLPELRLLRLDNVKLPANETFFQGTPKLNSLQYYRSERSDESVSQLKADMQTITSAMRNGHLKQLTDAYICLRTDDAATSLEYLQLMCKAVAQSGQACPKFQQLIWTSEGEIPLTSNEPDEPSLCKALIDLPAGILSQRPFTLEMLDYTASEISEDEDECNELINALHAAVQQSGLKRLRLSGFTFTAITATTICDLINAKPPLSATIDDNNVLRITWMHPTIEGCEQQVEMEIESEECPELALSETEDEDDEQEDYEEEEEEEDLLQPIA